MVEQCFIRVYFVNVMGLERTHEDCFKDSRALHKAILIWTRKNYAWLYNYNPHVAEACLVDGITHDTANHRIVRTYTADAWNREAQYVYLDVDPPPDTTEKLET